MSDSLRHKDERRKTAVEKEKSKEGRKEPEDGPKLLKLCVHLYVLVCLLFLKVCSRAQLDSVCVCV